MNASMDADMNELIQNDWTSQWVHEWVSEW